MLPTVFTWHSVTFFVSPSTQVNQKLVIPLHRLVGDVVGVFLEGTFNQQRSITSKDH